ncbi:MAG TPA: hypothetical protein VH478_19625 [Trebonia sp.]|nr:hypothetical protein [Trebonia sp.]
MTDNDAYVATPAGGAPPPAPEQDLVAPQQDLVTDEPGYLTRTGEVAAADGSVVPIVGGLPAVDGSAWDIGAPVEDRGANLAETHDAERAPATGGQPDEDQAGYAGDEGTLAD